VTANAAILMYLNHSILPVYHIGWTGGKTFGIFALIAYHRHTHYRMRIYSSHSYPGFFRIVYLLPVYGAGHFTNPTAGTLFRYNCYFTSHKLLLQDYEAVSKLNFRYESSFENASNKHRTHKHIHAPDSIATLSYTANKIKDLRLLRSVKLRTKKTGKKFIGTDIAWNEILRF
jgi:hypothetical protein